MDPENPMKNWNSLWEVDSHLTVQYLCLGWWEQKIRW